MADDSTTLRPVRGRLAPSPTGRMHIGHARSFLLAWWSARSQDGEVLLRIEDLDQVRAKQQWTAGIIEDLQWLGINWDGEVSLQSEQLEPILRARDSLIQSGLVYPCVCSRREVRQAASAPHEAHAPSSGEVNYPGTCRGKYATIEQAEAETGHPACLRFQVPHHGISVRDRVHGNVDFQLPHHGGDFIVMGKNGQPAYQLGVVVNDAQFGVTEVLRGDDLLVSAARQQLLYKALGLPCPTWVHVPLVQDESGERLAKRAGSTSLLELRETGVPAAAVLAWAATSSGLKACSGKRPEDYLPNFSLENLPRTPAVWTWPL